VRRTVLAAIVLVVAGGVVTPALAAPPPIPAHVYQDSNGAVCFWAFSWKPNCVGSGIIR
jgi:hypothetical protein